MVHFVMRLHLSHSDDLNFFCRSLMHGIVIVRLSRVRPMTPILLLLRLVLHTTMFVMLLATGVIVLEWCPFVR